MYGREMVLLILAFCLGSPTDGAKLLLIPINMNSHVQMMSRLGVALADEGHMTVMVAPSNARVPAWAHDSKMEIWQFEGADAEPYANSETHSRLLIKAALSDSAWERLKLMFNFSSALLQALEGDCLKMFADADFLAKVTDARFDLAILDTVGVTCNIVLPYRLGLPYISYYIYATVMSYRVPALPSFTPSLMSDFTDHMTFTERLMSFATEFAAAYMANHTGLRHYTAQYAPNRPQLSLLEGVAKSVFWFYLADNALGYPKPQMPNTAFIGDIMTSPAKTLPKDIEDFVTSAKNGVVVVSFGSYLDHLPPEVTSKLCKAFKQIPYHVIWKLIDASQCVDKVKIMTLNWLPQNDLLGHPNVILFVTHAGYNSLVEAVYHAKPMVAIPISLDQPYNAKFMTSRGLGDRIDLKDFSTEELVTKIQNVIQNYTILTNVRKQSELLKDKPESPGKRASFWIDHVLKYGNEHLRTGAYDLNVMQFLMMDIFLFIIVSLILCILFLCVCVVVAYRGCRRCFCPKSKAVKLKTN